jgi:hypothetical protein
VRTDTLRYSGGFGVRRLCRFEAHLVVHRRTTWCMFSLMHVIICPNSVAGAGLPQLQLTGAGSPVAGSSQMTWAAEAEAELNKAPFFVKDAARTKAEDYARSVGASEVTMDIVQASR